MPLSWNSSLEPDFERWAASKSLPEYACRCRALTYLHRHPDSLRLAEGSVVAQQRAFQDLARA